MKQTIKEMLSMLSVCSKTWSLTAVAMLLLLGGATSCSDDDGNDEVDPGTNVSIEAPQGTEKVGEVLQLEVGGTLQLTANTEVTWVSSNETAATVSREGGLVTAVGTGETTITATSTEDETVTNSVKLQVNATTAPNSVISFTFDGLNVQPTINGTEVTFEVDFNKEGKNLDVAALTPSIVHNGTAIEPADGAVQNFTGGPVEYTVTGDGEAVTYNVSVKAEAGTQFVTTWNAVTIEIPTDSELTYNYNVDLDNDGFIDETGITEDKDIEFLGEGRTVAISGQFPAIFFNAGTNSSPNDNADNAENIASVDQWGTVEWESMAFAFQRCKNLVVSATDIPDLSKVASMERMFNDADALVDIPNLSTWDTSSVTTMAHLFRAAGNANPDVSGWNISSISDGEAMRNIFRQTAITPENYGKALVRFAAHASDPNLILPQDIVLADDDQERDFCLDGAAEAIDVLVANGWQRSRLGDEDCN